MIDYYEALKKLTSIKQEHLLIEWDELSSAQKETLLAQIDTLDIPLFLQQQSEIDNLSYESNHFTTIDHVSKQGDREAILIGRKAIGEGLVGTLVMAGGQGTRLGFLHPKGMVPITKVMHKSLFQLVVEKTLACGLRAERELSIAFMTSKDNDFETKQFFKVHQFFGANIDKIGFFSQDNLPFLTDEKNLFLESKKKIAEGPDGNGSSIKAFVTSPLFAKWKKDGIRYVVFTLIDNPLADPFDEELVGRLIKNEHEVVIKAIERTDPNEKVGIIVNKKGIVSVIEYTEFPKSKITLRKEDGTLLFNTANTSLFCFTMDFIEKCGTKNYPLHKARKVFLSEKGSLNIWKFERFIFDILFFAKSVETVIYPRSVCFSPLKNKEGESSKECVQKALMERDRQVLGDLLQKSIPIEIEEIDQKYYYPTEDLKNKIKLTLPSDGYLSA